MLYATELALDQSPKSVKNTHFAAVGHYRVAFSFNSKITTYNFQSYRLAKISSLSSFESSSDYFKC